VAYNATVPEAADVGLAAWTVDPASAIISASLLTTVQYLAAVYYKPEFDTSPLPTKVLVPNVVVGSWTFFQWAVINMDQVGANNPGVVLATTTNILPVAGLNTLTLTWNSSAPASLPGGRYWLGVNVTGTVGTMLSASNPGANSGLGANAGTDLAHCRFGEAVGTGNFTLGANITPASNIATTAAGQLVCAALA
jgi:hypothetical protein